jgi:ribosomal protein L11 methyltransferase
MDTTILIPFPEATDVWSIARVVVDAADVTAFVASLRSFGVDHYPAGPGRAILSLRSHDWRATAEDFLASHRGSLEMVQHDDYDASWRMAAEAVALAPGLEVVARGAGQSPSRGVIVLNPGLAFGDCRHPTTRLCATAIAELMRDAPFTSLLDVGCGSGILALVAARVGAREITATDIDPYSRFIAKLNAAQNGATITVVDELPSASFDVVVANIWATAFPGLAAQLEASVATGGTLVLSGFPSDEADAVTSLFPTLQATRFEEAGWCSLRLERPIST